MLKFIIAVLLIFTPATALAASAEIIPRQSIVQVKDVFVVDVFLNSRENINAVEGALKYSPALTLMDINFSNSIVPLWVTPPDEREEGNISFAGVIPGGYEGKATLFTLVFTAKAQGRTSIAFTNDTKAYLNDGSGTVENVISSPYELLISSATSTPRSTVLADDVLPPEPFVPSISSGEPFGMSGTVLVFIAQDKSSGVMRYELARSYFSYAKENRLSWSTIESPYSLTEEDASRYLYVKAIDRRGNARIAIVPPQTFSPIAFALRWWPLLAIILAGAVILIVRRYSNTHINRTV